MAFDLFKPETWGQLGQSTDTIAPSGDQASTEVKEPLVPCPVHGDMVTQAVADAHVAAEAERVRLEQETKVAEEKKIAAQRVIDIQTAADQQKITDEQNRATAQQATDAQAELEQQKAIPGTAGSRQSLVDQQKQNDALTQLQNLWKSIATPNERNILANNPVIGSPIRPEMVNVNDPLELTLGNIKVKADSQSEMTDFLRFITDNRGYLPDGGTPLRGEGRTTVEDYKKSVLNEKALDTPERQAYQYWKMQQDRASRYADDSTKLAELLAAEDNRRAAAGLPPADVSDLRGIGRVYADRVARHTGTLPADEEIQAKVDEAYRNYAASTNQRLPEGWNLNPDKQQEFSLPNGWSIYHGDANTPAYYKDENGQSYTSQEVVDNPELMRRFGNSITPQMVDSFKKKSTNQPEVVEHLITQIGDTPEVRALLHKAYPELSDNGTIDQYMTLIRKQGGQVDTPAKIGQIMTTPLTKDGQPDIIAQSKGVTMSPMPSKLDSFITALTSFPDLRAQVDRMLTSQEIPDRVKSIILDVVSVTAAPFDATGIPRVTAWFTNVWNEGLSSAFTELPYDYWVPEKGIEKAQKDIVEATNPLYLLGGDEVMLAKAGVKGLIPKIASMFIKGSDIKAIEKVAIEGAEAAGITAKSALKDGESLAKNTVLEQLAPDEIKLPPKPVEVKPGEPFDPKAKYDVIDGVTVKIDEPVMVKTNPGDPVDYVDPLTKKTYTRTDNKPPAASPATELKPVATVNPNETMGGQTVAFDNAGKQYDFTYKLTNLEDLVASNDVSLAENPLYPRELQPRNRNKQSSKEQLDEIVNNFKPEAYLSESNSIQTGTQIVGPDNVVESGNGRTIVLQRLLREDPVKYQQYVDLLTERAAQFGFTSEDVGKLKNPVLVRVRNTAVDRAEFAGIANEKIAMGMSAAEQAGADAGRLQDYQVASLKIGEKESVEAALATMQNAKLMNEFLGGLTPAERGSLLTAKGEPNQEAFARLKRALFAKVYGTDGLDILARMTESMDVEGAKNIEKGMFHSLGNIAKAEALLKAGARDAGYSVKDDIVAAVQSLISARAEGIKPSFLADQISLGGARMPESQGAMLKFFDTVKSFKKSAAFFDELAKGIIDSPLPGQQSMMGSKISKQEIIENASREANRTSRSAASETQGTLEQSVTGRPAGAKGVGQEVPGGSPKDTGISEGTPGSKGVDKKGKTQSFAGSTTPVSGGTGKGEAGVKQSDIIQELSDKLNVPIRRGHFNQKALGIYKKGKEIIRIDQGQLNTVSHEIGHLLDDRYNISGAIPGNKLDRFTAEYAGNIAPEDKPGEALAEFIRYYITDPDKAKGLDAAFFAHFEDNVPDSVKTVLLKAQGDFARWKDMPATAKVLSQVELTPAKNGIDWGETFNNFYTDVIDKLHPISDFMKAAKKDGIQVAAENNPYIRARLLAGQNEKAAMFFEKGTFTGTFWKKEGGKIVPNYTGKPLREILEPVSKNLDDFVGYITAKRSAELGNKGIRTGISADDAIEAIRELEIQNPEFASVQKELRDYQSRVIDYVASTNMLDKETIIKLKTFYQDYVPFYRVMEDLASGESKGSNLVDVGTGLKSMQGSDRQIVNPLESIIKNTYALIDAADRNAVGQAMADIANQGKYAAQLFEKVPPEMTRAHTVVDVGKYLEKQGIDVEGLGMAPDQLQMAVDIFRPSFLQGDNIVSVLRNGKREFYQADPDLYMALKSINTEQLAAVVKVMSYPAKWLRAGATLSPDFWAAKNWIRDTMDAAIISRNGFIPFVDTVNGLFDIFKNPELYELWKMSGGAHSMVVSLDRTSLQQSMKDILSSPGEKALNVLKHPLEALEKLSEFTEAATRLGEYGRALKKTGSPLQAGFDAREVTTDFSRIGAKTRAVNSLIAFWNANIQGTDRVVRAFIERPAPTTLKAISGLTVPSVLLWYANHDDPRYQELPAYQKDLFWIILTPDNIYRIPKPFGLGQVFATMPERTLDWIYDKDPKQMVMALQQFADAQSPGFIPTAMLPVVEIGANYDFFRNTPIVPASLQGLLKSEQYKTYTSETIKLLGQTQPFLSPLELEHLFNGYTAGLGQYALKTSDAILQAVGLTQAKILPSPTLSDMPVIKSLAVRNPYGTGSQSVQDLYDTLEKYTAREKKAKSFVSNNNEPGFVKYKTENPDLKMTIDPSTGDYYSPAARYLRRSTADLSALRKAQDLIYRDENISPAVKRQKIDEIDKLITQIAIAYLYYLDTLPASIKLPDGTTVKSSINQYK